MVAVKNGDQSAITKIEDAKLKFFRGAIKEKTKIASTKTFGPDRWK